MIPGIKPNKKILEEIRKCGNDPVYFIKNYVKIRTTTKGLIPFKLFDYQEDLIRNYMKHRFNVILKARQLGISEVSAAFAAWLMIFRRQRTVVVIATKESVAKNLLKKISTAIKSVPKWLVSKSDRRSWVRLSSDNKTSVELDNGSVAKALASKEDAGHSEAVSFFIVDEASRIPKLNELWKGVYHTVQTGGRLAMISTPNGVGGLFHQVWDDAVNGDNEFHPTKLMWWVHPEHIRDEEGHIDLQDDPYRTGYKTSSWFRKETKAANLSPRQIAEQLECNFNSSGDTVISPDDLEWIASNTLEPTAKNYDSRWFVWHDPARDERYHISCDVARGDGRDFCAAIAWKSADMSQVSEYYGKIPPEEYARLLCKMGQYYNNALLIIENNSLGLAVLEHVRLLGYSNVYFSRKGDMRAGEAVNMQWGSLNTELVPGFTTSTQRRQLMIDKLEEYIRNKTIHIRSKRLLDELRTFVWTSDKRSIAAKAEATHGRHDDLVIAASIGVWIKDTFISPSGVGLELQRKLLDSISYTTTLNTSIVGASKDPRFVPQRNLGIFTSTDPTQATQMQLPNGEVVDFSWITKG